jgi:hypothetical protein
VSDLATGDDSDVRPLRDAGAPTEELGSQVRDCLVRRRFLKDEYVRVIAGSLQRYPRLPSGAVGGDKAQALALSTSFVEGLDRHGRPAEKRSGFLLEDSQIEHPQQERGEGGAPGRPA